MISIDLAQRLRDAALGWAPASGDRFVIPGREMDAEIFHVAEMTIEVDEHQGEGVVKFNGTTEWALDSVPASEVLWLPREDQLRAALGPAMVALEHEGDTWIVTYAVGDRLQRARDVDVETAYGQALLALLGSGG